MSERVRLGAMAAGVAFRTMAGGRGISNTAGTLAAASWLTERDLTVPALTRWHATILLGTGPEVPDTEVDEKVDTRFRIEIYSEEWGFFFCHAGRGSWIRITDVAFVHGRDDYRLLGMTPALKHLGQLLRQLEDAHQLSFQRELARIETNLRDAEPAIRAWVQAL